MSTRAHVRIERPEGDRILAVGADGFPDTLGVALVGLGARAATASPVTIEEAMYPHAQSNRGRPIVEECPDLGSVGWADYFYLVTLGGSVLVAGSDKGLRRLS